MTKSRTYTLRFMYTSVSRIIEEDRSAEILDTWKDYPTNVKLAYDTMIQQRILLGLCLTRPPEHDSKFKFR